MLTFLRTNKTTKKSTIQLLSQINANYAIACLYSEFAGKRKTKEKYYYQIMTSKTRKARDRPAKKRITGRISHSDTSSQIRSSRCKRANTLYQRQSCDSISIPQLVYELLTIDKYNHGKYDIETHNYWLTNYNKLRYKIKLFYFVLFKF